MARRYCARLTATSSRVGVAVILVFRSRLLPEAEPEIGAALAGYLAEEVITVLGDLAYKAVRRTEVGVTLTVRRNGRRETVTAEHIVVATGRSANTNPRQFSGITPCCRYERVSLLASGRRARGGRCAAWLRRSPHGPSRR